MKGRVFQRKRPDGALYDAWSAVVDIGIEPATGRRKQLTRTNAFKTEREGWRWVRLTLLEVDRGEYVHSSSMTVGDYLADWLPSIGSQVKASTHLSYSSIVKRQIVPRLGAIALQDLKASHLRRLYSDLAQDGSRRDGEPGGLSTRTIRYVHAVLQLALRDAVTDGLVQKNVALLVKPPKLAQDEMKYWTGKEAQQFLAHAEQDRLWAAWALALCTGMRKGEILGLRWKDVDLEGGRLTVNQTLISVGYEPRFGTPKSVAGGRTLDLDSKTVQILKVHRSRQAEERLAWGPAYKDSGLVFTRENGELIHPEAFGRAFKRLVKESGVPVIRFHDCRHTSASLALQAGVNIFVVSRRLGHASVSFTLDTYGHELPGQQEDAAKRVAAIIYGA